jgi:hypothetical protein
MEDQINEAIIFWARFKEYCGKDPGFPVVDISRVSSFAPDWVLLSYTSREGVFDGRGFQTDFDLS